MVTNLPAEARAKWIKVMDAKTPEEKIAALEEFLKAVPKHKGTENLRLWASRRLAELREEVELRKRKRSGRGVSFFIEKEGAGQIVVLGPANTGKSSIVKMLTGARTRVADYPMSTRKPVPGMLKYEDIYFQLVDTPPLVEDGGPWNNRVIGLARNANGIMIVLSMDRDPLVDYKWISKLLTDSGILLTRPKGRVVIEKLRSGKTGIRVTIMGRLVDSTVDDVRRLLEYYRIYNAHVKIYGEVSIDDVEAAIFENKVYRPAVIIVNKADINAKRALLVARRLHITSPETPIIVGSARLKKGFSRIGEILFRTLGIIRVYTKQPNGPRSDKPLILPEGSTVMDAAKAIHRDFVAKFKYARIWGPSAKYPGERVGLTHVLKDGDILEIHISG
jgi:ribosome-interacting GTPase 1